MFKIENVNEYQIIDKIRMKQKFNFSIRQLQTFYQTCS